MSGLIYLSLYSSLSLTHTRSLTHIVSLAREPLSPLFSLSAFWGGRETEGETERERDAERRGGCRETERERDSVFQGERGFRKDTDTFITGGPARRPVSIFGNVHTSVLRGRARRLSPWYPWRRLLSHLRGEYGCMRAHIWHTCIHSCDAQAALKRRRSSLRRFRFYFL